MEQNRRRHLRPMVYLVVFAPVLVAASPQLSPRAASLIAPVHQAFVDVRSQQASEGPPKNMSEALVRLGQLDQAGRDKMQLIDLSPLSPEQQVAASKAAWKEINKQDSYDRKALVALLPPRGWFTISRYGKAASEAAWSIVQHQTNDPAFMADMLARMTSAVKERQVDPGNYALLTDRVAMLQNRKQEYGSQFVCVDHHWSLYPLEDPASVDERRMAIGYNVTEAQTEARIASYAPCYFAK
jgi:hypothetical protein